jgi:hypothetical protein
MEGELFMTRSVAFIGLEKLEEPDLNTNPTTHKP